jgi:hypothetical protein
LAVGNINFCWKIYILLRTARCIVTFIVLSRQLDVPGAFFIISDAFQFQAHKLLQRWIVKNLSNMFDDQNNAATTIIYHNLLLIRSIRSRRIHLHHIHIILSESVMWNCCHIIFSIAIYIRRSTKMFRVTEKWFIDLNDDVKSAKIRFVRLSLEPWCWQLVAIFNLD